MGARDYIICSPSTRFEEQSGSGVYRKELVYPGNFVKKSETGSVEFELPVDDALMDHWVATFNKMKQNGVEVPVPVEHTTDPEARRGTVVDLKKEPDDERGGNALYAYIKFRDDKTADALSRTSQVSLFSPPVAMDGKGNKYVRPIKHVALTDYPLIPGLKGFETIAASLLTCDDGDQMNSLYELAMEMGIEGADESMGDEELKQLIVDAWNSEEGGEPDMGMEPDDEELSFDDGMEGMDDTVPTTTEEMMDDGMMDVDPLAASFQPVAASIVRQIADARKTKLTSLVQAGKITPAVRKHLEASFCSQQRVSIALSQESGGGHGDDFDTVIAALSLNEPVLRFGERTGTQHASGEKAPTVADAERRAAAQDRQRRRR